MGEQGTCPERKKNEVNKTSYMTTEQGWNAIEGKRHLSHWEIFLFLIIYNWSSVPSIPAFWRVCLFVLILPQHNKSFIWQTHNKHYPQWWKIKSISPKVRNKKMVPTLTTTIQHSFGGFGHSNRSRKRNKRNPDRKTRSKTLTVCRWSSA